MTSRYIDFDLEDFGDMLQFFNRRVDFATFYLGIVIDINTGGGGNFQLGQPLLFSGLSDPISDL